MPSCGLHLAALQPRDEFLLEASLFDTPTDAGWEYADAARHDGDSPKPNYWASVAAIKRRVFSSRYGEKIEPVLNRLFIIIIPQ